TKNTRKISIDDFTRIIQNHSVYGRSKQLLTEEINHLKNKGENEIRYDEYLAFNHFVQHFDNINSIVQENAKNGITKEQFSQMLGNAHPGEVDIIFRIFDKQNKGKLD